MPFIDQKSREELKAGRLPKTAGERCYSHYRWMVEMWNMDKRWTTADEIYKRVALYSAPPIGLKSGEDQRAKELAWQVFFQVHVIPYERMMQECNGDI